MTACDGLAPAGSCRGRLCGFASEAEGSSSSSSSSAAAVGLRWSACKCSHGKLVRGGVIALGAAQTCAGTTTSPAGPGSACSLPRLTLQRRHSQGSCKARSQPGQAWQWQQQRHSAAAAGPSGRGGVRPCAASQSEWQPLEEDSNLAAATARVKQRLLSLGALASAFYRFTRPHTMAGTTVSIVSVSTLALQGCTINAAAVQGLAQALSSALLMNISIVGLNQVFDVDIDRVNKPYLPLASGEFTVNTGIGIVLACTVASLWIGLSCGSLPLLWTLALSLILGILYSTELPFMRWKKHPVLAVGCILAVRAVLVQLGFFLHMKQAIGSAQICLTRSLLFTVTFMLFFSVVIAIFKDIPDVKGDSRAGVKTFSVRYGVQQMFWNANALLVAAYSTAIVYGFMTADMLQRTVTVVGHVALTALLLAKAKTVDLNRKSDLVGHYMFIWKLFYAEYLLIPFL